MYTLMRHLRDEVFFCLGKRIKAKRKPKVICLSDLSKITFLCLQIKQHCCLCFCTCRHSHAMHRLPLDLIVHYSFALKNPVWLKVSGFGSNKFLPKCRAASLYKTPFTEGSPKRECTPQTPSPVVSTLSSLLSLLCNKS